MSPLRSSAHQRRFAPKDYPEPGVDDAMAGFLACRSLPVKLPSQGVSQWHRAFPARRLQLREQLRIRPVHLVWLTAFPLSLANEAPSGLTLWFYLVTCKWGVSQINLRGLQIQLGLIPSNPLVEAAYATVVTVCNPAVAWQPPECNTFATRSAQTRRKQGLQTES